METIVTPIGEGIVYYNDLYEWAKSFGDDPAIPTSTPCATWKEIRT